MIFHVLSFCFKTTNRNGDMFDGKKMSFLQTHFKIETVGNFRPWGHFYFKLQSVTVMKGRKPHIAMLRMLQRTYLCVLHQGDALGEPVQFCYYMKESDCGWCLMLLTSSGRQLSLNTVAVVRPLLPGELPLLVFFCI